MDILTLLKTLTRHKTAAALIVLEMGLTCAIVTNAMHLVVQRVERLQQASGVAEDELVRLRIAPIGKPADAAARVRNDLALLQQLPGVKGVTITNSLPFSDSSWNTGIMLAPGQQRATLSTAMYAAGDDFIRTLGLKLVAGRDFRPEEITDFPADGSQPDMPVIVVNRRTADKLFPGEDPLGKVVSINDRSCRIIGVVEELARPSPRPNHEQFSTILPFRLAGQGGTYVLRTTPAQREAVKQAAVQALRQADPLQVIVDQDTYTEVRQKFFRHDKAMVTLLVGVSLALLLVTALGIVGLVSFWVQQRTVTIGIRRALGARRAQILRYFQLENLLLAGAGALLGVVGAFGINLLLMGVHELPRLPLGYLPLGAAVLLGLGQVAVLAPALRAARLPPATVMRDRAA
jgi:putative ABC transport system permease protein